MFTGLIQTTGTIDSIEALEGRVRLIVRTAGWVEKPPRTGDSIAVDGCCLTVAAVVKPQSSGGASIALGFDVIPQTLDRTTIGQLRAGDMVNLEPSARPSTLLGGHIVQGHVDGTGRVTERVQTPGERRLRIEPPAPLMDYIAPQGSIAIAGVSLTIAAAGPDWFEVALIPTTLELTTLSQLDMGDLINIECDYVAKVIVNWLRRYAGAAVGIGHETA